MSKSDNAKMEVSFWGTRGTLPAPGPMFARAGGNTNCTAVTCAGKSLIFDAGTGIRELGSKLISQDDATDIHLFLTHAHYDHVEGLPFFAPFFHEGRKVHVYCGELDGAPSTEWTVKNLMRRPYFPVGPEVFTADVVFHDLKSGDRFKLDDDVEIATAPLAHPGGATGYRVSCSGKSFSCVTDTEHEPGKVNEDVLELIENVDMFMYDSSLTDEELPEFAGYGHSTFEEGLRLRKLGKAKSFMAFHHMPFRTDAQLEDIEKMIKRENADSGVAREGDVFVL